MLAIVAPDWALTGSLGMMAIAGVTIYDVAMLARTCMILIRYQFHQIHYYLLRLNLALRTLKIHKTGLEAKAAGDFHYRSIDQPIHGAFQQGGIRTCLLCASQNQSHAQAGPKPLRKQSLLIRSELSCRSVLIRFHSLFYTSMAPFPPTISIEYRENRPEGE